MAKPFKDGQLVDVDVDLLTLGPQLIRHDPNDENIIELAASITEQTLLEPGGFTILPDGTYQLLYGSRRLAAHKRLKRRWFPCIYKENKGNLIKTIAIVENIQRRDLTLNEEIDAITYLHDVEQLSPDQISTRVSKSRAWVMRRLAIPSLPEILKTPVLEGRLPIGQAEAIALIPDDATQSYALQQVLAQRLTESQTRELVGILRSTPSQGEAIEAGVLLARSKRRDTEPELRCEGCFHMVPIRRLVIVRVCNDGCKQSQADHQSKEKAKGETNHA